LSGVYISLITGDLAGYATSSNLGELSFAGPVVGLPVVELEVDFSVDTFGDLRASDGLPVADGGDSGYRLVAQVDFSDIPFAVTEYFVKNNFYFSGQYQASDESNLRLDQIGGSGDYNDAINADAEFEYASYDYSKKVATYYLDIGSLAPTSDAYCGDLGSLENCGSADSTYTYGIGDVSVYSSMSSDFELNGLDESETAVLADESVVVYGTKALNQSLSFAPLFEINDLGVIGSGGTRVASSEEIPTLAEDVDYDFAAGLVRNHPDMDMINYALNVDYEISDADYDFGVYDEATSVCDYDFTVNNPTASNLTGKNFFTGVRLCPVDDPSMLDDGVSATVNTSFSVTFIAYGETAYYESEYFTFADRRAGVWTDPRIYVLGTASGLSQSDDATLVGNVAKMELRDGLYEEFSKVTRGAEPSIAGGTVGSVWGARNGGIELDDGNILYFVGSASKPLVTIDGGSFFVDKFSNFSKTIVVVGANVFVDSNISKVLGEGELGIIVFAEDGRGGNMYVDSDVTDLHANIYLDGKLTRADKTGDPFDSTDLKNQLYILGSIVSQNTMEGYRPDDGICQCGDGSICGEGSCDEDVAEQDDLQYTSYFQVCYPVFADGTVDTSSTDYEMCEGYDVSTYDGDYWMVPVIIEYSPPSLEMPIFTKD